MFKMNCSTIGLVRASTATPLNSAYLATATATVADPTASTSTSTSPTTAMPHTNALANGGSTSYLNRHQSPPLLLSRANVSTTTTTTTSNKSTKQADLAANIIRQSDIVCFDVDSTVIEEEGIDELAAFCGKGSEVARVTKEAMTGTMTFQRALEIRLNIIRPTQQQIHDFVRLQPSTLTRNVKRFIEQLKADGKQVYLISGGFDCLIEPVAQELGISPLTNLFANKLLFNHQGDYVGFDTTQPTSRSGGKGEAISLIRQKNPNAKITMIGDGMTDYEAVPPANYFIGFGGNVMRAEVYKKASYYVLDFEQLMPAA